MNNSTVLAQCSVDPHRGFLTAEDPLRRLPPAYAHWEELVAELPKLLGAERVHQAIDDMPELPADALHADDELNRAMLLLSYLGHAYVFGGTEPRPTIPAVLARPWYAVATRLGRPPVLSYASHALYNWRRFDPAGPIELGNLGRLVNFLGGLDEDWFVLVHVAIEAAAAPGLTAAVRAGDAVAARDAQMVTAELETIAQTIERMLSILRRMPEKCDPYIYYQRVRQFIFGWMDNPALPQGVWYEGVDAYAGRPQQFRGETGAQSSIIPAFDAVLGLDYRGDWLGDHVVELRDYMPPLHRRFLDVLAAQPSVREFVLANADTAPLVEAYNWAVRWSGEFRRQHLTYAGEYIRKQQQSSAANPVEVGTGGTPFMTYLAQHVKDTERYLVAGPAQ